MTFPRALSRLSLLAAVLPAVLWWAGADALADSVTETRLLMGTIVTVTVSGMPENQARVAIERALGAMAEVDREMARIPGTPLWKLNQAGRGVVSVPLLEVVQGALTWARRTCGVFDPTVAPLLDVWDFQGSPHAPPSAGSLGDALRRVGWGRVRVDPRTRRVELGGTSLDLGGIAKGYALERASAALRRAGCAHFLVDAGGDVLVAGRKGGKPWRVGIQQPRDPNALLRIVEPSRGVLLTSGDYQRGFEWKGERYHHLLDPRTGQPARGCRSVTLWAPKATLLPSAAVFVLGPRDGLALAASVPGVEALVVDAQGQVRETPGFERVAPTARIDR